MNLKEVHRVLHDFYQKELTNGRKRHVVFWYDEEGEFIDEISEIDLLDVRIWKVTPNNLFATKYELEKKDPASHFLLYANMARPNPREDWLLDIYKMSDEFATDKITVTMRELGINDDTLRETFKEYKAFFNSKARFQTFRKFPVDTYTHETVDITVLAALTKSNTNAMDDVIKTLMRDLQRKNIQGWENIKKFGSIDTFWELVEKYYGYMLPEKSLQSLFIYFIVTYTSQHNEAMGIPETWQTYISARPTNVIVFMDQWMNHRGDRAVYNALADQMEKTLRVSHYMKEWDVSEIAQMDAFRAFDEKIIDYIAYQLTTGLTDYTAYLDMIATRRKLHWYPEYKHEYEAIHQAVLFFQRINDKESFIPEQAAYAMVEAYTTDYYKLDTCYRKFYAAYDQIEAKDRLHALRALVENSYAHDFMDELALKWAGSLEAEGDTWALTGMTNQTDFYQHWVHPYNVNNERVFVIISDALRYEVAAELMNVLNNERKATTNISAMQSVLPSYTALGMAALLPHKQLAYTKETTVLADGANTTGLPNRDQILSHKIQESAAVRYSDIIDMNRKAFREHFQGKKIIYIYHNTIDARGDNVATEMEVFQAAEEAINDIRVLVNRLVTDISASNILVTADHGFMYQRDALTTSQKTPQDAENAFLAKRRFIITESPADLEGTLTYPIENTTQGNKELFVTVPKGVNRFAIQGAGANFVHGGAMLQEIVVPVITFKNDRSKSSANQVRKVDVKLTTPTRKITNTITYLTFLQTDRIEDKKQPLRLRVYFADEAGERVSNENIIIADSVSTQPGERTYREKFVFKSMAYDKRETYYLILEEGEHLYEQYPFTIDILHG